MITKSGNAAFQNFVANPNNRIRWDELSPQHKTAIHGFRVAQRNSGGAPTKYSVIDTPAGKKYFDWDDFPD